MGEFVPRAFYHPGGVVDFPELDEESQGLSVRAGWYYLAPWANPERISFGSGNNKCKTLLEAEKALASHMRCYKWKKIWQQAADNMPKRQGVRVSWIAQPKGQTPFADFAVGMPKGTLRMVDGVIYKRVITHIPYGANAVLARLLGYITKRHGKLVTNSMRIYNARSWGNMPRDPRKRELLEALASPSGNAIAWAGLEKLGLAKRYKK